MQTHFLKTRSIGQHVNFPPAGEHSYWVIAKREHGPSGAGDLVRLGAIACARVDS